MEYVNKQITAARDLASGGVPLWWVGVPSGLVFYLVAGVVVVGLAKRWLGDRKYRTDSFDYLAGAALWPCVIAVVAGGGLLWHTFVAVAKGWRGVAWLLDNTVVRLARHIGGELPDATPYCCSLCEPGESSELLAGVPTFPGKTDAPATAESARPVQSTEKAKEDDGNTGVSAVGSVPPAVQEKPEVGTVNKKDKAKAPADRRLEISLVSLNELVTAYLVSAGWNTSISAVLKALAKVHGQYVTLGCCATRGPLWWAREVINGLPSTWPTNSRAEVFGVVERAVNYTFEVEISRSTAVKGNKVG
jgi:hypothetical protein